MKDDYSVKELSPDQIAQLLEGLGQCNSMDEILDIGTQLLQNPFFVIDMSYNLLGFTKTDFSDDWIWNEMTTTKTYSHQTIDFFMAEMFVEEVANSEIITILKSEKLKYDRMCGKFFDSQGISIGTIGVLECYHPFGQEDFAYATIICEKLGVQLEQNIAGEEQEGVFGQGFIRDLIEGGISDKAAIEKQLGDLYQNMKENLFVAVVDVYGYDSTITHLCYIRDILKKLDGNFKYFIYLNNIVILISTDLLTLSIKRDLAAFGNYFEQNNLCGGVSSSFQNLLELPTYYKQALSALNFGMSDGDNQQIFLYDDLSFYFFLNSIKDDHDFDNILNPVVQDIQNYDKNNNTKYLQILYAYLSAGKNIQLASKRMKLTHNSFAAAIRRIQKIFDLNCDNAYSSFGLFLSCKNLIEKTL